MTGILLAWKKNADWIQPPTTKGQAANLTEWLPLHQLASSAQTAIEKAHPHLTPAKISRIDARPSKGIVKVLFKQGFWEVQLDAQTGKVNSIAQRHSDWIEALHDGSIISDGFKLISMNILGIGLILLILFGFKLWYSPRKIREMKRNFRQKISKESKPETK